MLVCAPRPRQKNFFVVWRFAWSLSISTNSHAICALIVRKSHADEVADRKALWRTNITMLMTTLAALRKWCCENVASESETARCCAAICVTNFIVIHLKGNCLASCQACGAIQENGRSQVTGMNLLSYVYSTWELICTFDVIVQLLF